MVMFGPRRKVSLCLHSALQHRGTWWTEILHLELQGRMVSVADPNAVDNTTSPATGISECERITVNRISFNRISFNRSFFIAAFGTPAGATAPMPPCGSFRDTQQTHIYE